MKSKARLLSLILAFRMQKEFYIEDYADFSLVYNWLLGDEPEMGEFGSYSEILPDMCSYCMREFKWTHAGRVRIHCAWCPKGEWNPFLKYYWPDGLCQVLGCSESVLESYAAVALYKIGEAGANRNQ